MDCPQLYTQAVAGAVSERGAGLGGQGVLGLGGQGVLGADVLVNLQTGSQSKTLFCVCAESGSHFVF